MKRILLWIGTASIICFSLLGAQLCLAIKAITVFCPWDMHRDELRESARSFEKSHEGINVKIVGTGDVSGSLPVLLASGVLDGVVLSMEQYPSFVEQKLLVCIDDILASDSSLSKTDFFPFLDDIYSYKGKWYGLPFNWGPTYFHYNVDLFEESGLESPSSLDKRGAWTWDSFATSSRRITRDTNGDGKFDRYGYRIPTHAIPMMVNAWMVSNGGGFVDNFMLPTKMIIDTPQSIKALQFLMSLYRLNGAPHPFDPAFMGWGQDVKAFSQKKLGIHEAYMYESVQYCDMGDMGFEWDVVGPPLSPIGRRAIDAGSAVFAIVACTKSAREVYEFAKFHLRNISAWLIHKKLASMPPIIKIAQNEEVLRRLPIPRPKLIFEVSGYACQRLCWTRAGEFWDKAWPLLSKFWNEELSVEMATKEIARLGNVLLEEEKKRERR